MSKEISKEKTNSLLNCPFCNLPFKKIGSKRRGNQHYIHDKYMESNCILKGFGFKASEGNFERWNTRIPMQNIVERLEDLREKAFREVELDYASAYFNAIQIVAEEGGMNERI